MNNLNKYLKNYAEAEVDLLSTFPRQKTYSHTLIIPAYKEQATFIDTFIRSSLVNQNVLLIIVINQPVYEKATYVQQYLYEQAISKGQVSWQQETLTLINITNENSSLLLVDRYTLPIEDKLGVGLARKIGADLACYLIHHEIITTDWVHSTDADAKLPDNYFSSLIEVDSASSVAACYNFSHKSEDKMVERANAIYEQALRYYVAGLTYAKSSYNYFTIGSVLAFKAEAYSSVRGFPKRSAGEDFYLLNKLAKLGNVIWLNDCLLTLEARMSDRVPFGTGPAVKQIVELTSQGESYCYYHPVVFERLKELLTNFNDLYIYLHELSNWYEKLPEGVQSALVSIGFETFINKQNTTQALQFSKQLIVWFDAFKTLKFIHYLRDNYYHNLPLNDAILKANFHIDLRDERISD
jgi:hypothetical protein